MVKTKNQRKIERKTHQIDATGKALGRLAVQIVHLLRGKNRPAYVPYLDNGDNVVIENVSKLVFSGRKLRQKSYLKHTGYLGHLKETKLETLFEQRPGEVLRRAVYGMLPNNKLRSKMIKRLKCYA